MLTSTTIQAHIGMCDASAAVPLGPTLFAVANDEDNVLRVYEADKAGSPIYAQDFSHDLQTDPDDEVDIEAAAWLNDRIFWISSHGRNKRGKWKSERHRLFTTKVEMAESDIALRVEHVYTDLVDRLLAHDAIHSILHAAVQPGVKRVAELAPKKHGLNIEGLCTTPERDALLIGFRNPIPSTKALLIRLENPEATVQGHAEPEFSAPMLLDLGGLGIRSIDYSDRHQAYLIAAGPHDSTPGSRIYKWFGGTDVQEVPCELHDLNPEALLVYPGRDAVQLLSDDGTRKIDGEKCKDLSDPQQKRFRSVWIDI